MLVVSDVTDHQGGAMVGLARTALETSRKALLAASALASQGIFCSLTQLALAFEVSRPTVYSAKQQAQTLLSAEVWVRIPPRLPGTYPDL